MSGVACIDEDMPQHLPSVQDIDACLLCGLLHSGNFLVGDALAEIVVCNGTVLAFSDEVAAFGGSCVDVVFQLFLRLDTCNIRVV